MKTRLMAKNLGWCVGVVSLILGFVVGGPGAIAQTAKAKVTVGIPAYYEGFLPLYTALEKRFFEQQGLDVSVLTFKGGGAAGQAFVSGAIDLCLCSFDHVLKLQSKGFDAVAIAGIEEFHAYALLARKGQIQNGLNGLIGRKIGITSPGSATDITVRYELKKAGIDAKNVSIVSIGSATAMKAALQHGEIDAGMVIGGILVEMLNEGGWEPVIDFRKRRYPLESVIARRAWVNEKRDVAQRFVSALVRAEELLQTDSAAAHAVTKSMFPKMDPEIARGVAEAAVRRLSPDGSINEEGVETIQEQQLFAGEVSKKIPYREMVDLSLLPKK